jgi:hypothetical protein
LDGGKDRGGKTAGVSIYRYQLFLYIISKYITSRMFVMKNIKIIFGIALFVVTAVLAFAQYDPESDFRAEPMDGGRSVRITGYTGDKWTIRIPPRIRDLPVTHIGDRAFRDNKNFINVTIPNNVTSIGWQAFFGCTSLTNVTIPNNVTAIEGYVFNYCTSLTVYSIEKAPVVQQIRSTCP